MGDANRKRLAPCICNSGLPANRCCWTKNGWHKAAASVQLHRDSFSGSHQACYLNGTNSCCDKISGEHLVSEAVLKVFAEKQVEVSGLPWLKGTTKRLPIAALATNCLCREHNSALTNLDTQAGLFFSAIQECGTSTVGPEQKYIFSGHDIERWMLKTTAAMAVSKNLGLDGKSLPGSFHADIGLAELLEKPDAWKRPLGLYLARELGSGFRADSPFQLRPLISRGTEDIAGLLTNVQGLQFGALAISTSTQNTDLEHATFRPGQLIFHMAHRPHKIMLSWNDREPHINMDIHWKR